MPQKSGTGLQRFWTRLRQEGRWLIPGMGVKRWLVVFLAGVTLLGVGLAVFTLEVYRTAPDTWWLPALSTISLRFLVRPLRVLIFGGLGIGMILWGAWGMNRALLRPFVKPGGRPLIEAMEDYRRREHGPHIVAIGGGHGLATLLRGLKAYSNNITAIVTVADDGGSSGELRRSMGILPPGDIRNCLTALSNDEAMMGQIFQYRFASGAGLNGHSLGNLFITALTDITGSFEEAVAESGRVLAVKGQVLPATLHDVRLVADVQLPQAANPVMVVGESNIPMASGKIKRVWLEPTTPPAFPPVISAILSADLIVIGPGSLYTSILPNLLVPDLLEAVRASRAMKVFVVNVATQPGETDGYNCSDHIGNVEAHVGSLVCDVVLCNRTYKGDLQGASEWVKVDQAFLDERPVYQADLIDPHNPWRHDADKLARVILDLFFERTGPLA